MRMRSADVVAFALIAMAAQLLQGSTASAESDKDRAADRAAIEKLFQQDICRHGFTRCCWVDVCRLAGWRGEAGPRHRADGVEEAPERPLEVFPRDGDDGNVTIGGGPDSS